MKKYLILTVAALFSINCGGTAQQTTAVNSGNQAVLKANDSTVVSSHSTETNKPASAPSNKGGSTESPMARPIDVAEMTAEIEKAEKAYQKNQSDEKAKNELARAYFVRATALTGAAQYRAALGDYRKGLRLNSSDEDARKMHDQILSIFKQINREPPKEGEEPPPLPFEKKS